MAVIVFPVRAGASEGDFLSLAIGEKVLVDKLTAIVRVQPEEREGQALPHPVHCAADTFLSLPPYRNALRPPCGDIHCG